MFYKLCLLSVIAITSCTSTIKDDELYTHEVFDAPAVKVSESQKYAFRIGYLVHNNKIEEAVDALFTAKNEDPYFFHSGILSQFGLQLLEKGLASQDPQDVLSSLIGIKIARDDRALHFIEERGSFDNPELELLRLTILAGIDRQDADLLLLSALRSNYLFVRMQAAYLLAEKKHPAAYEHIEALMHKLGDEYTYLFPRLFALDATYHSTQMLRKLLFDANETARIEAIMACRDFMRDDFLSDIRRLASDPSPRQQEACAAALAAFKDEQAIEVLSKVAELKNPSFLAAHTALHSLGVTTSEAYIIQEAREGNLFAIRALGGIPAGRDLLYTLQQEGDIAVRVNATLALLELQDSACLLGLKTLFIDSHSDLAFHPIYSAAGAHSACRVTCCSQELIKKRPILLEESLRLRQQALIDVMNLGAEEFLLVASAIFEQNQKDLIPCCIRLLEAMRSDAAIKLLKEYEQKPGAPYVRAWCQLALYRLDEPGPWADRLRTFLEKYDADEVFHARPQLALTRQAEGGAHELHLDESSELVIQTYLALAEKQNEEACNELLEAIRDGNEHNRFALGGLLIRSSQ